VCLVSQRFLFSFFHSPCLDNWDAPPWIPFCPHELTTISRMGIRCVLISLEIDFRNAAIPCRVLNFYFPLGLLIVIGMMEIPIFFSLPFVLPCLGSMRSLCPNFIPESNQG
jgi:hypothetical protein